MNSETRRDRKAMREYMARRRREPGFRRREVERVRAFRRRARGPKCELCHQRTQTPQTIERLDPDSLKPIRVLWCGRC